MFLSECLILMMKSQQHCFWLLFFNSIIRTLRKLKWIVLKLLQPSSSNFSVFCVRYNPASMDISVHCVKIIRLQVPVTKFGVVECNKIKIIIKVVSGSYKFLNHLNKQNSLNRNRVIKL